MRRKQRRRKTPLNTLTVDAELIRDVVCDGLDFSLPGSVYDFVYEADDETLNWLGEEIIHDGDLWLAITDTIISYAMSLKFQSVLDQGGLDNEQHI